MTDYKPTWTAVWQFQKRYLARLPSEWHSDTFWEEMIDEADKTAQQCGNTRFARDLISACMSEFESISKEYRQNAKRNATDMNAN